MKKRVAILGSTGSIGTQTLEIISSNSDLFEVEVITAHNNVALFAQQIHKYQPNVAVITNTNKYDELLRLTANCDTKIYCGIQAVCDVVQMDTVNIVVTAMVGYAGLDPTISAIKAKKTIALANKETLVVAGDIITKLAIENKTHILPVDSEHSAIFQCLVGEVNNPIEKIILTASGGPFRNFTADQLQKVTKAQALNHPNWDMGSKITIDSATMMNKGFEAIEAKWLFDLKPEQIDIVVHPQSIVHSLVQFQDSSIKAQLGLPDMRMPIIYALAFPNRIKTNFERFDFMKYPNLEFHKPDTKVFRCIDLAYQAMHKGGNIPCIMNAANEIAVEEFLNEKIPFFKIPELIETAMNNLSFILKPSLDDYCQTDLETRKYVKSLIK
ncbi:MAG: 1-deoxy-D-xylulose-5-phosphate reductoisomerase [Bacteroidales bacterium]|nr:1-deoxy-D-xylulose-5-phosphate reductoisomerase [Bacteroidales bacterium]